MMGRASDDGSAADDDARATGEMNRGRRPRKTWCASGDEERAEEGTRGRRRAGARDGEEPLATIGATPRGVPTTGSRRERPSSKRRRERGRRGSWMRECACAGRRERHSGPDDARRGAPCRRVRRHRYSFVPRRAAVVLVEQPWCRGLCLCSHDVVVVLGAAYAHNDELARAYVVGGHALSRVSRPLVPRSRFPARRGRSSLIVARELVASTSNASAEQRGPNGHRRRKRRTPARTDDPVDETFPREPVEAHVPRESTPYDRYGGAGARGGGGALPRQEPRGRARTRPFRRDGHGHAQARTAELHASRIRAQGRRRRAPRLQRARGHDIAGARAEHFDAVAEHLKATLEELDLAVDVVREAVSTVAPVGDV